ncbi:MAG: ABC transporter permease, partial [Candidatus Acetothermia bacterium]
MTTYIVRRLLLLLPVLLAVAIIIFGMVRMLPGDPARALAGVHATPEYVARVREEMGLNKPLYIQFGIFMRDLVQGNLGRSTRTKQPVLSEIWPRFLKTLQLTALAMFLAALVGISAGVISATRPYSIYDQLSMLLSLFGVSVPVFWLGLILMLIFAVHLGWLPSSGTGSIKHFVLPGITLAARSTALIARISRSSMLEVLGKDFIDTARSKGVK